MLLSGGVDSALALALLAQAGADVRAFYLKIWLEDDLAFLGDCPWQDDLDHAQAVCDQFSVPLTVVALQDHYYDRVVAEALAELRAGRTPSPDILCNHRVKFGAFREAVADEAAIIASGHYARIGSDADGTRRLLRAPDPVKDQTYFLSNLDQAQLARAAFPIGHLCKDEVRQLASDLDLAPQARKDSQGICFLGKISYRDFVRHHLGEREGEIVEQATGQVLGYHRGVWFHTIGQRQGLGLHGGPWYVVAKDTAANALFVSHSLDRVGMARDRFATAAPHWIAGAPAAPDSLMLKLRHGPAMTACAIGTRADGGLDVTMTDPDPGVAPGQSAVFYCGDECLGRAVIVA
jgi:tRNA-specific 2-thiouridylase